MNGGTLTFAAGQKPWLAPPPRRAFVAHWLTAIGLLCAVLLVVLLSTSPGLFLLAAPMLLLSLALVGLAGAATLIEPPRWADIGLIVFAFAMMDTSMRKGGVHAGGFDAQSIFKGLVWLLVLAYAAIHGTRSLTKHPLLLMLAAYCLLAFVSALYSKSRLLGLGSGIALLAIALYAALISRWDLQKIHRLWNALFAAVALLAAVSLIMYFAFPSWARDYLASGAGRMRGVTGSGNSLGPILCIGLIVGACTLSGARRLAGRAWRLALMALMASCLVLTESRGSAVGLVAAFVILASFGRPLVALASSVVALLAGWAMLQPGLLDSTVRSLAQAFSRSGNAQEIASFTGRSDIWAAIVPKWLESPWIGYGLGSPRVVVSQAYTTRWGQTYESAHNWLLESLLSFGVIGTAVLVAFLVALLVQAWRLRRRLLARPQRRRELALANCLLRCWIFLLVSGMVEKSFAGMPNPTTVLFAFMAGTAVALQIALDGETAAEQPR